MSVTGSINQNVFKALTTLLQVKHEKCKNNNIIIKI